MYVWEWKDDFFVFQKYLPKHEYAHVRWVFFLWIEITRRNLLSSKLHLFRRSPLMLHNISTQKASLFKNKQTFWSDNSRHADRAKRVFWTLMPFFLLRLAAILDDISRCFAGYDYVIRRAFGSLTAIAMVRHWTGPNKVCAIIEPVCAIHTCTNISTGIDVECNKGSETAEKIIYSEKYGTSFCEYASDASKGKRMQDVSGVQTTQPECSGIILQHLMMMHFGMGDKICVRIQLMWSDDTLNEYTFLCESQSFESLWLSIKIHFCKNVLTLICCS